MSHDMKQIAQREELVTMLATYARAAMERPDFQEPTFLCPACSDTGFILRTDSVGRGYGRKCECLVQKIEVYRSGKTVGPKFRDRGIEPGEGIPF